MFDSAFATAIHGLPGLLGRNCERHGERTAFIRAGTGEALSFAAMHAMAGRILARLREAGIGAGDIVAFLVDDEPAFMPMLAACAGLGARLLPLSPRLARGPRRALLEHCGPKLLIGPDLHTWLGGLGKAPAAGVAAGSVDLPCLILHTAGATGSPKPTLLTTRNLLAMAEGFLGVHGLSPADVVLTASTFATAAGVALGGIVPALAGACAVIGGPDGYWEHARRHEATICHAGGDQLADLLAAEASLPASIRFLLSDEGTRCGATRTRSTTSDGRPMYHGYGATETTFWVACSAPDARGLRPLDGCEIAIRPSRQAPALDAGAVSGEIVVRGPVVAAGYLRRNNLTHTAFEDGWFRTGDLGWFDPHGHLVVRGRLAEITLRDGVGMAVADIDAALGQHPGVLESKTVLLPGHARREGIVSACVTRGDSAESVAAWLAMHRDRRVRPDQVVRVAALPRNPSGRVSTPTLTGMIDGTLCHEIVAALGGRKYRRSPPHREDVLRERVQAAVLQAAPLDFLMLWGCGKRDFASVADWAALACIGELLAEPRRLPHMTTRAHIVFTDMHAKSNGHADSHASRYLDAVRDAGRDLDVSFTLESEVWAKAGLTAEDVRAFEDGPDFAAYWRDFALRDKFVEQATRHSRNPDPHAAARHYLATCRMEREAFARVFPNCVFLTYNGPEFNLCFPDLPTLYIYPGRRGRTVKPWFSVETAHAVASTDESGAAPAETGATALS